jgi:hypothetical protein
MKAIGRELRWALCGFIGGFILCFVMVHAINKPSQSSQSWLTHTYIPADQFRFTSSDGTIGVTQKAMQAVHIENWDGASRSTHPSPVLQNVPMGTLPPRYSVDLIDGRDRPPKLQ